jgi:hypothetical protein
MDQLQEHPEHQGEQESAFQRCFYHPDVETALGCGKCGRYICTRCIIQTPVGARCRECARVTRLPTYDVQPTYYLRAVMAGGVVGIVGGIVWGLTIGIPFLPWFLSIGIGYLVGEAISVASNRKRGPGLAVVAGVSMALAVVFLLLMASSSISIIILLLIVALGVFVAIQRVR